MGQRLPTPEESKIVQEALIKILDTARDVGMQEMSLPTWMAALGFPDRENSSLPEVH